MRADSRYGFNVITLAVMTVVVVLLVLALLPATSNAVMGANMSAVGSRGRDIYVAITGANTEREPLGLPPVWPSEGIPLTNTVNDIASVVFSNSTDYFNCLFDGKNLGKESWNPFVAGLDYTKLAGAGVPAYTKGKFTAANNLWTVAMNVRDEMEDVVPVLITRNIDASSLAAKVTEREWDKTLRFDPEWETPYGDQAFLLIRKGGSIFKCRAKYSSYGTVYSKRTFDATVDVDGQPVAKPLKYLTPTRTVVPGERDYTEGAVRVARSSGGIWKRVKRNLRMLAGMILPVGVCVGAIYLLVMGLYGLRRYRRRLKPYLSGYGVGVGLFHFVAVVLWLCLILVNVTELDSTCSWTLLSLAILAQVVGIAFVIARRRDNLAVRLRRVKWMITAPLIVGGGLFLMLVFLTQCSNLEIAVALLIIAIAVVTVVVVR